MAPLAYRLDVPGELFATPSRLALELDEDSKGASVLDLSVLKRIYSRQFLSRGVRVASKPSWLSVSPERATAVPLVARGSQDDREDDGKDAIAAKEDYRFHLSIDNGRAFDLLQKGNFEPLGVMLTLDTGWPAPFDKWNYAIVVCRKRHVTVKPNAVVFCRNGERTASSVRIVLGSDEIEKRLDDVSIYADNGAFACDKGIYGKDTAFFDIRYDARNPIPDTGYLIVEQGGHQLTRIPWRIVAGE